jgi:hypothetical protein
MSSVPQPTAPDADLSEGKTLETLIEEATNIATANQAIICEIREAKQFQVLRYYVDTKLTTTVKLDVEEVTETHDYEALCKIWRVSPQHKLTAITPDLFKDGINYDCNTMDDVITVNDQMLECCKKYWFLDQNKASPYILKFIKNFQLLQASLDGVRESYLKPKSQLDEVRERVSSINSSIEQLSAMPMVSFGLMNKFVGGTILDDKMQTTLSNLFRTKPGKLFVFLASSANIGTATTAFDNAVRGKGPFVVIIRATTGHVFGAYIPEEFSAKSGHQLCSPDLFLFSLGNLTGTPHKFLPIAGVSTMHFGSCGLHINGELVCFCSHSCGDLTGRWTAAPGYPAAFSAGTLCGTPGTANFTPQLMEIYTLSSD